jgi:hypothetical protein
MPPVVVFRLVVFRPVILEVILAKVRSSDGEYIWCMSHISLLLPLLPTRVPPIPLYSLRPLLLITSTFSLFHPSHIHVSLSHSSTDSFPSIRLQRLTLTARTYPRALLGSHPRRYHSFFANHSIPFVFARPIYSDSLHSYI